MNFSSTLTTVAGFLNEEEIRYALIGGLALAAYGHSRSTLDIDLVVEYDHQNAIVEFMESRGFETLHRSSGYSNHQHEDPVIGRVDFVYVQGETAEKLFDATREFQGPGALKIPVPKPEHLIAMKVLAMKNDPDRTFQELADIRILLASPGVDRREARSYFERHGLLERFHELE